MIKKKILVLTLIAFNFVFMMVGCSNEPDENKTNEEPLLLEDTLNINDFKIKHLDSQYSNEISYIITPTKFDLDLLEAENYKMEITLTYDVHYNLHGYETLEEQMLNTPKYEISILNSNGFGKTEKPPLGAASIKTTRTVTVDVSVEMVNNKSWVMIVSTDNQEYAIYFTNIVVSYRCHK